MGKTTSLVASAQLLTQKGRACWFDKLKPAQVKQLLELRRSYQNKDLPPHVSLRRLWKEVIAPAGIAVSQTSFTIWMGEK